MNLDFLDKPHTELITEWVTGGDYAVKVEVEATFYPQELGTPYLSRETVLYLEKLDRLAKDGDVQALQKAGTVYVRLKAPRTSAKPKKPSRRQVTAKNR